MNENQSNRYLSSEYLLIYSSQVDAAYLCELNHFSYKFPLTERAYDIVWGSQMVNTEHNIQSINHYLFFLHDIH